MSECQTSLCVLFLSHSFLTMQSDKTFPTTPMPPIPPPPFLRREIKDSKWWAGVSVLEANPNESECWVAEHYTGYKYVLTRGKKGEYIKNTYFKNTYVEGSDYVLISQCPFTTGKDTEVQSETVEKSSRLADPESAQAAYISLLRPKTEGS
jgi:hypothetical protein